MDDVRQLESFLRSQSLGYPNYQDWVSSAMDEVVNGCKTAVVALEKGTFVGDLVWQPHKGIPGLRELKNMRVHPLMRKRGLARFIMKQAEVVDTEGIYGLICDVREENEDTILFLQTLGYIPAVAFPLYDSNEKDVVMVKPLRALQNKSATTGLITRVKEFFPGGELY